MQVSFIHAVTVKDLKNNKEAFSRILTNKINKQIESWIKYHNFEKRVLKEKSELALSQSVAEMNKKNQWCEISFIQLLKKNALKELVITKNYDFINFLNYLRYTNQIDDLLLEILLNFNSLESKLSFIGNKISTGPSTLNSPYSVFLNWPSENNECLQDTYSNFLEQILKIHNRNDSKFVGKLNYKTLQLGIIDQKTFEKIEALRFENVNNYDLYLNSYIKNIRTVKDKLTENPEEKTEISFSEFYVYRRNNLTRRGKLYTEYTNTQILLMSQLIEKTAKRIDATQVHLYFQYDEDNLENEIYIFSPMEQYRIAVKMLRKDMAELKRSDLFRNTPVYYEDVIAAAFETGIISSKELNSVLEFDDLWNPRISKWKGIANFSLSIAGTATFLLPTPFNYVAAIALIFTQSKLAGGNNSNDPEDNENVII